MNQAGKSMRKVWRLVRPALLLAGLSAFAAQAAPISFSDLLARPRPAPTKVLSYGSAPQQYGQLWSPAGPGPYPVVVMIHGGCWLNSLPGPELMAYISEDLRRRGVAVWSIDYRRVGGAGGGYPGTFEDVGRAVDYLRTIAPAEHLDLHRLVAVGHSAGGHLALWRRGAGDWRNRTACSRPIRLRSKASSAWRGSTIWPPIAPMGPTPAADRTR